MLFNRPVSIASLCVFAGSSAGGDPAYAEAARELGRLAASRSIRLVYGGGRVGLMGTLADAALAAGGQVIGVIPRDLWDREVGHGGLTDLEIVVSMHARKQRMSDLASGFVALPGGIGTLEELFEVWTWAQLGIHGKPCGLLNVGGYYDPLVRFLDSTVDHRFVKPVHRAMLLVDHSAERLLERMEKYRAPEVPKWIGKDEA